jgi:intracellular multiplication protein IcmL
MASNDAMVLIFARNAFYRRLYHLMLGAFGLSLLAIIVLSVMIVFLTRNPVHPIYFATDNVSRLIQVVPVGRPSLTPEEMIAWVEDAVEGAYSYDYLNYPGQLQAAQKYFTNYGWKKYLAALAESNNLVALKERKMIVTAKVAAKPTILKEGILAGSYAWQYQMPVLVTYLLPPYDGSKKFANALNVTVIVQRQPALEGYKGIGIVQLIAKLESSSSSQPREISNLPAS